MSAADTDTSSKAVRNTKLVSLKHAIRKAGRNADIDSLKRAIFSTAVLPVDGRRLALYVLRGWIKNRRITRGGRRATTRAGKTS